MLTLMSPAFSLTLYALLPPNQLEMDADSERDADECEGEESPCDPRERCVLTCAANSAKGLPHVCIDANISVHAQVSARC